MDRNRDLVMMKGGRMIMLIDGEMLFMETDIYTADGVMVRTDGTLIWPDGTARMMGDDEAIVIDAVRTMTEEA